jgi:thiamine-phosphate pyrophosphorylase
VGTLKNVLRCYITDRKFLRMGVDLVDVIAWNLAAGIDWVQIREKDLAAHDLYELVARAVALPRPRGAKILVNSRVDVALAAGADGAHLPAGSPSPGIWRDFAPAGFLLGASCHTIEELLVAESQGADYALFGPVFLPRSKPTDLPVVGLEGLAAAARKVRIPVLALGGISEENAPSCLKAGAAGIAGISMFQR